MNGVSRNPNMPPAYVVREFQHRLGNSFSALRFKDVRMLEPIVI
jgi:hypothetical protein